MAKKRANKKKNPQSALTSVRLSQCMIVRNEEKNIEKALSWAKDIAFEQIVVDTGSTDQTVEIAKQMGATVYHFKWIDDFSAAKNFAIAKCSGNWIAMLDADEYFSKEDAKKLYSHLIAIKADPTLRENCLVLNTALVNLDDDGKPASVYNQERVFRNIPSARYKGRIHEVIDLPAENVFHINDITVFHTGYAKSVYDETGKAARNIDLLKAELKDCPDDLKLKSFLADALVVVGDEQSLIEATKLYREVITMPGAYGVQRITAYKYLIEKCMNTRNGLSEAQSLCLSAIAEFPDDIDIAFFYGAVLNRKGEYKLALRGLKDCEQRFLSPASLEKSTILLAKPLLLFFELTAAAQGLNDVSELVKYATMTLSIDKNLINVLAFYLSDLIRIGTSQEEILELLAKVYDLKNPSDLMIIAKAAKECGAVAFAKEILEQIKAN